MALAACGVYFSLLSEIFSAISWPVLAISTGSWQRQCNTLPHQHLLGACALHDSADVQGSGALLFGVNTRPSEALSRDVPATVSAGCAGPCGS